MVFTNLKDLLLDSNFQIIGSNMQRVLRHSVQTHRPILGPGEAWKVDGVEGIGCKAGEVGLEVEPQAARGGVHLTTEITSTIPY